MSAWHDALTEGHGGINADHRSDNGYSAQHSGFTSRSAAARRRQRRGRPRRLPVFMVGRRSIRVLSRAGIVVVLRPGATVYQVNDREEVADTAPSAQRGELFVTPLAGSGALATASRAAPADRHRRIASAQRTISLEARQLQGAEAITVDGTAPPDAPVTITLLAIVSSDVPTIVVSRHDVVTDVSGHFAAVIPIASAYERGTILRVVATSLPGVGSASAQLVTAAPNDGVDVPLEQY